MVVPSGEEPGDLLGSAPWPKAGPSWGVLRAATAGPCPDDWRAPRGCAVSSLPLLSCCPNPATLGLQTPRLSLTLILARSQVPGVQTLFFSAFLPSLSPLYLCPRDASSKLGDPFGVTKSPLEAGLPQCEASNETILSHASDHLERQAETVQ